MPRPSDPHARARLLEAARSTFCSKGLDRSKVEDITSQAQLSKGAFYLHFQSKEEAFRELLTGVISRLELMLEAATTKANVGANEEDPGDLTALFEECHARDVELFEFVWENRAFMAMMLEGCGSADYQHLIEDFAMKAQRQTASLLKRGVEAGLYRDDLNFEAAAAFIAGGYDRLARQLVRLPVKPNLHVLLRDVQLQMLGGVARPPILAALSLGSEKLLAAELAPDPASQSERRNSRRVE